MYNNIFYITVFYDELTYVFIFSNVFLSNEIAKILTFIIGLLSKLFNNYNSIMRSKNVSTHDKLAIYCIKKG